MECKMPAQATRKIATANPRYSGPYTHTGVQRLIHWILDSQGIGQFELSKRSGLSPATIYQILNKSESQVTRPPRRSSLSALATAVGAEVHFDVKKNQFYLTQQFQLPDAGTKELNLLLSEIGSAILSRRTSLAKDERERIVRVVKAVLG
jgi:transcriptional regulator with XRE-family HTH domain